MEKIILEAINKSYNIENLSNKRTVRVISLNNKFYKFKYKKYNRKDKEYGKINFTYDITEITSDEFYKLCPYANRKVSNKILKKRYSKSLSILKSAGFNLEITKEDFILGYRNKNGDNICQ